MSDDVQYRYDPKVPGAFLLGVPARDLTAADVEQLEPQAKADLEGSDHYVKVGGKVGEQNDPDPRAPGRVDADTISGTQGTPTTDEPVYDAAPSFVQADSSPIDATLIGAKDKGK